MLLANQSLILLTLLQNLSGKHCSNCIMQAQIDFLNKIVGTAHEELRIETLVFFGNEAVIQQYIAPIMPGIPKLILTQTCRSKFQLPGKFGSNIFFLAFGRLKGSAKWHFLSEAFDGIQRHVRGIFVASYQQGGSFPIHFAWCWRSGFVNVITLIEPPITNDNGTAVAPFRLFSYSPFPKLNITEVPLKSLNKESLFANKLSDFRGFKMRTVVQYDPPRVFQLEVNSRHGRSFRIVGYAARTFWEFLKYHNGQLEIVPKTNLTGGSILDAIEQLNNGEADLSMNIYFTILGVGRSYPLSMTKWCIMLPSSGGLPAYAYFLRPFEANTWLAYAGMLLFLSFVTALSEFIRTKAHGSDCVRFRFGRAFLETMRLMLFVSTPPVQRFKLHYAFNYMLIAIFGFILSNYYLAVLTSFRARTIFEPQLDTIQEMVDHNISINAIDYELPLVLRNRGLPKGFADLLVPRKYNEFIDDILTLRGGRAYLVRDDTLKFVFEQQTDKRNPKFHAARECIATMPVGFLMPSHSQFKTVLDIFALQVSASGLGQRWAQLTIGDGFRAGLLKLKRKVERREEPLTLLHFQFAFLIILIGSILAFVAFLFEQFSRFDIRATIYFKGFK